MGKNLGDLIGKEGFWDSIFVNEANGLRYKVKAVYTRLQEDYFSLLKTLLRKSFACVAMNRPVKNLKLARIEYLNGKKDEFTLRGHYNDAAVESREKFQHK